MRFLIVPWVEVAHLASHILGRIARRISADWQAKYAHRAALVQCCAARDHRRTSTLRRHVLPRGELAVTSARPPGAAATTDTNA